MSIKNVVLFPGVGSVALGIGKDFYDNYQVVRDIYNQCSEELQMDMFELCFSKYPLAKSNIELQEYILYVTCYSIYKVLESEMKIDMVAGYSFGEYVAISASNVLSVHDAIQTIKVRQQMINKHLPQNETDMIWVLGVDYKIVKYICEVMVCEGKKVFISAINSNHNISISGLKSDLLELGRYLEDEGGVLFPLNVGGPYHCELMKEAAKEYYDYLHNYCNILEPNKKILFNSTGQECFNSYNIRKNLSDHICNKILWKDIMSHCLNEEYRMIEIATNNIFSFILKDFSVKRTSIVLKTIEDLDVII